MRPRLAACTTLAASAALAHGAPPMPSPPRPATADEIRQVERDYRWFDPIIDLKHLIETSFVAEADPVAMQQAALDAMVRSLGDPYSAYVPPTAERDLDKQVRGNYVGIGADIDEHEGVPRIVAPYDDSPALEAGLMPGDLVLEIDGVSTAEEDVDQSVARILGEPGSMVSLRVRHADGREEELALQRRAVTTRTVRGIRRVQAAPGIGWDHMLDAESGIAYLRLTQFTETTPLDTRIVLDRLRERGITGLVLDLRFNPGGSVEAATQIADFFLGSGTIVRVKGRDGGRGGEDRVWHASADATDIAIPLVLLVNDTSASASEILAGALAENLGAAANDGGTARVLGTRTFGKGSVQELRPLPGDRGVVKLTTAAYLLPSGRSLSRSFADELGDRSWGVDPDPGYRVAMDDVENVDMLVARRRWEMPDGQPADPRRWSDPEWIAAAPGDDGAAGAGDPQLAAALRALRGRLDGGSWPRVGDDPSTQDARSDELDRALDYRERLVREIEATDRRIEQLRRGE